MQAPDRPVLPMSPGRIERHGFEYPRHGTLSLYVALDVRTGKVQGKTTAQHTSEEFVRFLHPHLHLHYTPTYSSWLSQVEMPFGRIEREVIARGVFTSVRDLARKLMRYIRTYSKTRARSTGSTLMFAAECQHANEFAAALLSGAPGGEWLFNGR
jgi:hypothetical protein